MAFIVETVEATRGHVWQPHMTPGSFYIASAGHHAGDPLADLPTIGPGHPSVQRSGPLHLGVFSLRHFKLESAPFPSGQRLVLEACQLEAFSSDLGWWRNVCGVVFSSLSGSSLRTERKRRGLSQHLQSSFVVVVPPERSLAVPLLH